MKPTKTLGFKLTVLFAAFLLVVLLLCGVFMYVSQMLMYKAQCQEEIKNIGATLTGLIEADGENFTQYQKYYLDHYADVNIPVDVDEYQSYRLAYEKAFAKYHKGRTLGVDISFDELNEKVKKAYLKYRQVYWLLTFEKVRSDFNLPYTYYLVPDSDTHEVIYMIDGERTSRAGHQEFIKENPEYRACDRPQGDEEKYLYLCDTYYDDPDKYPVQWKTWETGQKQDDFQVWKNLWGNTYAYYTPLYIKGEKLGLVGVEMEIETVNTRILHNTLMQLGIIAAIMIVCLLLLNLIIRRAVRRIVRLEENVAEYTSTKDVGVAEEIRGDIRGEDEIAVLSLGVIKMIHEIRDHIERLTKTSRALDQAESDAAYMADLAMTDPLTGIGSSNAYQKKIEELEEAMAEGTEPFGIAMIDLNFLKYINDNYGHEMGNSALKKLCQEICETFRHSPVYRVGGDEFVVVLQGQDYEDREELIAGFSSRLENLAADGSLEAWERISAAIGLATMDEAIAEDEAMAQIEGGAEADGEEGPVMIDTTPDSVGPEDVFRLADSRMYKQKKRIKTTWDLPVDPRNN